MTARSSRTLALGFLAALALIAAGCGGGPAASSESGATFVRADALAYVSLDTDLGSSQWQQVNALSKKFPGRDLALSKIEGALAKQGLDFQRDVKPALGPEVDLAVAAGATPKDVSYAWLTQPADPAVFKSTVAKLGDKGSSGEPTAYREVGDGWYALSGSQKEIDQVLAGDGKTLADDSTFNDALGKLPDDALVKAYANGHEVGRLLEHVVQQSGADYAGAAAGLDKLDWLTAALTAEDDGVRVKGVVQGAGSETLLGSGDYISTALGEAPADALAFLSFQGGKGLASALGNAGAPLTMVLGMPLDELLGLFENETALYVRPGIGIPEITLVLDPSDTSAGLATLDKLAARIAVLTGGQVGGAAGERSITIDGVTIHWGSANGKIVVTNAANGVSSYDASGEKLSDSADFKEARDAAGMPDSNGGMAYIDLKDAIPMILGLAGLSGSQPPPVLTENLRPLRSFLAWNEGSGDTRTFNLFLEIK